MDKKPVVYEKGQFIYQQGDSTNCIYMLKKGKVRSFISSANGTEKTIAVYAEGSLFGKSAFFDKQPHFSCAKALARCEIMHINRVMMAEKISRNPQFALDMLEDMSKTIRMLSNQIESMSFYKADIRVAHFLTDNINDSLCIHCTHDEISEIIGATRVTVNRVLNRFERNGLIETHYRMIKIVDVSALKAIVANL